MTLADGRRLHWHEFGDPDGAPVFYTSGTPTSGLSGGSYDGPARAAGLRWISPDKPGYGGSDYHRERTVVSWSDDLAALAAQLGLDQFALAGESGGGPFTLVAAHQLAKHVIVAALISTSGPYYPEVRADQKASVRLRSWFARNAPALLTVEIARIRRQLNTEAKRERLLSREMATTPEANHDCLRIEIDAVADALRPGTRAAVQEIVLTRRPWPFPLSEVSTPVHVWSGALDNRAPLAFARRITRELPDATLHVSESSGHDCGYDCRDEIVSVLSSYLR
jgi:pimeloyl-ACP methyl ester carboxylesterase